MRDFIIRSSQIISEFSDHLPRIFPESWKRMRRRFWEDFFGRSWQKFCFDLARSSKNQRRSCEIKADVLSRSSTKIFPESATHSLLRFREDSWKMIRKIWYDLGWFDDEIPNNLLRSYTRFDNLFFKIWTHLYSLKKLKQSNAIDEPICSLLR